ncbi:unnamed protein product [Albugo candida]|uniref:Nudix hydrolase domain-containing protein n=1 Tax=Albugo candida TaxID=65357 RepID=A0A024GVP7_9STRA|nr:unnamed protein product [Albugo candida]|eukprot:CCI50913.1 unnamed protein product [Albugo candida]
MRIPKGFWTVEPGTEDLSPEEAPSPFEPDDPELIVGDGFHLAPRITEDDKIKNQKSLDRALANHVVLLTRQPQDQRRSPYDWFFPFGEFKEGVKMRKMALRQLKRTCGKELDVYPIGNAPIGYVSFLHKEKQSEDAFDGTKIFLYKTRLMGEAQITLNASRATDYVWVTREELNEYLEPELASYIYKLLPP